MRNKNKLEEAYQQFLQQKQEPVTVEVGEDKNSRSEYIYSLLCGHARSHGRMTTELKDRYFLASLGEYGYFDSFYSFSGVVEENGIFSAIPMARGGVKSPEFASLEGLSKWLIKTHNIKVVEYKWLSYSPDSMKALAQEILQDQLLKHGLSLKDFGEFSMTTGVGQLWRAEMVLTPESEVKTVLDKYGDCYYKWLSSESWIIESKAINSRLYQRELDYFYSPTTLTLRYSPRRFQTEKVRRKSYGGSNLGHHDDRDGFLSPGYD